MNRRLFCARPSSLLQPFLWSRACSGLGTDHDKLVSRREQMKVDNLKAMSEKQTACQEASIESLTKLISDTAKNQEASIESRKKQISESHAGLFDQMVEMREQLFEAQTERFKIQESVLDTQTFTRSAFASTVAPAVLICGVGGQIMVMGMLFGWSEPAAITLACPAAAYLPLAVTFGTTAGIFFNVFKYSAKADKQQRAMVQKAKEDFYCEKKAFHIKQQEAYRKEIEKRAGDK